MIANPPTSQFGKKAKKTLLVMCSLNMTNSQKTIPQNLTTLVHFFHQKILCTSQTGFFWSPSDKNLPKQMSSDF